MFRISFVRQLYMIYLSKTYRINFHVCGLISLRPQINDVLHCPYTIPCSECWTLGFFFMIKTQIIKTYLLFHASSINVHFVTWYIVYDWMSCHLPSWYYIYCIAYLVRDMMLSPVSLLSQFYTNE